MRHLIRAMSSIVMIAVPTLGMAHGSVPPQAPNERAIEFPDTASYKTLVLDLHTHSVFSDGHVWPTIRVAEAQRDGLDGFAVTEHLEYQPHITDIPHADRNRSFEEARRAAAELDLTVIPGVEITRQGPTGHINAVFIEDANALDSMREALFAHRTVVWWKDTLIGRERDLLPLLEASIGITAVETESWGIRVRLKNESDAPFVLRNDTGMKSGSHSQLIDLPAHGDTEVTFSMNEPREVDLEFTVMNALVAPNEAAVVRLSP